MHTMNTSTNSEIRLERKVVGNKLTPEKMTEKYPGTTRGYWAQLRFKGTGPRFYKPSKKVVFYDEDEVESWFASTAQTQTERVA